MAAPALRKPQTILQPDGSKITIVQQGDEWCHWITDQDGQLLVQDAEGYYRVATIEQQVEWEATKIKNLKHREEVNSQRLQQLRNARRGMPAITEPGDNHAAVFPSKGQIHGLIVLVEYQDVPFREDSIDVIQHYQDMINKEGYSDYQHQGSAHDFFYQNSMGQFDPQFDIYGPIKLSHNRKYYGQNSMWGSDARPHEMLIEACEQLDSLVDFTLYDNNNDGDIDFVFAFYAGGGEHAGEGNDCVWPHAWDVAYGAGQYVYFDGVRLGSYACSCETLWGTYDGVGTFCHEFTHVLGLPDIYDVNYSAGTFTPGEFDVLDQGSYNGASSGSCPAGVNTYERYELGWIEPEQFVAGTNDTLTWLGESNRAFILPVKSSTDDPRDGEYYLFENRQKTGWDTYLPGHGMLVWHVDYHQSKWEANNVNTTSYHQGVDIVEADHSQRDSNRAGDPFPGTTGVHSITATTNPALLGWDTSSSRTMRKAINGAAITNIQELALTELSEQKVIVFHYTDNSLDNDSIYIPGAGVQLLNEDFEDVMQGSDNSTSGSSLPFKGTNNIVSYTNAYQAGSAVRLGKAMAAGNITTRPLDNAAGDSIMVEIDVKGWTSIEGTLLITALTENPDATVQEQEIEYTATIGEEYNKVSCKFYNCEANTQIKVATSQKRCFISNLRVTKLVEPQEEESDIRAITLDQVPARSAANKIWVNGQLMIQTADGLYNMQGVRQ